MKIQLPVSSSCLFHSLKPQTKIYSIVNNVHFQFRKKFQNHYNYALKKNFCKLQA